MMTEIPPEILEDIPDLCQLIDGFSDYLAVLQVMSEALLQLVKRGHFAFQAGFTEEHSYGAQGTEELKGSLARLQTALSDWDNQIENARSEHYFLNHYTARESLKLVVLLDSAAQSGIGRADNAELHLPQRPVAPLARESGRVVGVQFRAESVARVEITVFERSQRRLGPYASA